MSRPNSYRYLPGAAFAALLVVALATALAQAAPLVIPADGKDGFLTIGGTTIKLPVDVVLPSGFFPDKGGVSSDALTIDNGDYLAVSGHLAFLHKVSRFLVGAGCHTGSVNVHCYEMVRDELIPVDTVVERGGGTFGALDLSLTVPISLFYLSLKLVSPVEVTYAGSDDPGDPLPSFFDVFVTLDGPQTPGTLTLFRNSADDVPGVNAPPAPMDTQLPVDYKVQFEPSGTGTVVAEIHCTLLPGCPDTLRSIGVRDGNRWSVPEPGSLVLLVTGVLGLVGISSRRRSAAPTT